MSSTDSSSPRADDEDGDDEGAETDEGFYLNGADLLEWAIVVASVLLVLGTLVFVGLQATGTTANGVPSATVEGVEPMPGPDADRSQVRVRLDNRRGAGLSTVSVTVHCGDAVRSLSFEHVPAGGHRTGTVVCPGDSTPVAEVVSWKAA